MSSRYRSYRYTVEDKERQYDAYFKHPATPPLYLYLYYVDQPDRLFSCEEYHYENHKGLLLFPVIFLPWILAGLALVLLGVELPGHKGRNPCAHPPSQVIGQPYKKHFGTVPSVIGTCWKIPIKGLPKRSTGLGGPGTAQYRIEWVEPDAPGMQWRERPFFSKKG